MPPPAHLRALTYSALWVPLARTISIPVVNSGPKLAATKLHGFRVPRTNLGTPPYRSGPDAPPPSAPTGSRRGYLEEQRSSPERENQVERESGSAMTPAPCVLWCTAASVAATAGLYWRPSSSSAPAIVWLLLGGRGCVRVRLRGGHARLLRCRGGRRGAKLLVGGLGEPQVIPARCWGGSRRGVFPSGASIAHRRWACGQIRTTPWPKSSAPLIRGKEALTMFTLFPSM